MRRFLFRSVILAVTVFFAAVPACAGTCTSPAGKEADVIYNSAYHTYQFCNGTSWIPYQFGTAWQSQATYNPTYPAGVGFFVLSNSSYTGILGDLSGADSTCLTDLTTHTGWKGYSTANGRGLLTSGKVHAFLCDGSTCNNPTASTTYYFASGENSLAGGASFTTDGSGNGPQDYADWGAPNYFWGMYTYWTSRQTGTGAVWGSNACGGANGSCNCNNWASGSSAGVGVSSITNGVRWNSGGTVYCYAPAKLICFVNP